MHTRFLAFIACLISGPVLSMEQARIQLADSQFMVELAVSEAERRQGLMYRSTLAPGHGMLFVYSNPRHLSFWMKNTLIPLDILFFSSDGQLQEIIENVPPCTSQPCPMYKNTQAAQFILELAAGSVTANRIKTGMFFDFIDSSKPNLPHLPE